MTTEPTSSEIQSAADAIEEIEGSCETKDYRVLTETMARAALLAAAKVREKIG